MIILTASKASSAVVNNANSANTIDWQAIMISGITGLVTFLSVALAAYLTYRFTTKHSHATHNTAIKADRLKRQVNALENMWELLAYTSVGEGERNMLRWRKDKQGNKQYFIHYDNLKAFLTQELGRAFYAEHAGLYLSCTIRDDFFEYRRILMGFYLRYEKDEKVVLNPLIELKNEDLAKKISCKYNELNKAIKDELDTLYNNLKIN